MTDEPEFTSKAMRDLASQSDLLRTLCGLDPASQAKRKEGFHITAAQAGEMADLLNRMGRVALKIEGDGFALELRMKKIGRAA